MKYFILMYLLFSNVSFSIDYKAEAIKNIRKRRLEQIQKFEKVKKFISTNNKCDLAISYSYPKDDFHFMTWKPNQVGCFIEISTYAGTVNEKTGCALMEYDADTGEYLAPLAMFGGGTWIPQVENAKCTKEVVAKLFKIDSSGLGRLPPKRFETVGDTVTQYAENYESQLVFARNDDLQALWRNEFNANKEKKEKRLQEEALKEVQAKKERDERLKKEIEEQDKKKRERELKKKIQMKKKQEEESLYE